MEKQTRSSRRGNAGRPEDVALAYVNDNSDQPGLEERYISEYIGKGVFATREFQMGDFLLQYKGELISGEEGERREKRYSSDLGNFLYFFQWNEASYCIDATFSHGLGRLVNDLPAKKANCKMKKMVVSGRVCLCIFATRDIAPNTELRYDYGLKDLPWRVKSGGASEDMNKKWKNSTRSEVEMSEGCEVVPSAEKGSWEDGVVTSQNGEKVTCAEEGSCKGGASDDINKNWKNSTRSEVEMSEGCEVVPCAEKGSWEDGVVTSQNGEKVTCAEEGSCKGGASDDINKNWKNSTRSEVEMSEGCEVVPSAEKGSWEDGVVTSQNGEKVTCAEEGSCKGGASDDINKNWKNSTRSEVEMSEGCEVVPCAEKGSWEDGVVTSQNGEKVTCAEEGSCKGGASDDINKNWKNSTRSEVEMSEGCEVVPSAEKGSWEDGVVTSQNGEKVTCAEEGSCKGGASDDINKNWKNSTRSEVDKVEMSEGCEVVPSAEKGSWEDGVVTSQNGEKVTCAEEGSCKGGASDDINKNWKNSTRSEVEMSEGCEVVPCAEKGSWEGLGIPLGSLCGPQTEKVPVPSDSEFVRDTCSSEENDIELDTRGYTWKRCHDSTASEESEEFSVTRKKSCRKAAFSESESGSYGERHADICGMERVSCDPSSKGKFQRTKLTIKTSRNSKDDPKRHHESTSGEEVEEVSATRKKKPRRKPVLSESETDSERERGADALTKEKSRHKEAADEVVITCVKKREDNVRVYDKRQACFFCEKLYAKISRHYEHNHKDKSEVVEAFAHPLGSKERKKAIEKLRLQGNFHHNLRVLESKSGQLIVFRRPGEGEECSRDDFLPCPYCLGFMKKKDLWRHVKGCNFRRIDKDDDIDDDKKYQKLQTKSKLLILPSICPGKSSLFQDVVASMKSDHISVVARNDAVISALGTMIVEKVGSTRCHDISQKMRNLARLLISLREAVKDENAQLSQFLRPDKFDVLIQCVMQISKFDVKRGEKEVGTPSLALHIGHSLKKCVCVVRGKALREKDKGLLEDVEHFEKLMEAEWNFRISHHSITTLNDRKHNQPELLPVTNDLKKLKEFITSKIIALTSELQGTDRPFQQTWRDLSEMVLNRLILFNKRRGGETAKLHVETYINRPDWSKSTNQDVVASLNGIEQQLLQRLDMVEIKGKRGRKVPLLLTKEVKEAIDVLVEKRTEVGINQENPYLFAATGNGSLGHLRAWECMRKVVTSDELKLEKPEAVTSTRLRKYVATVSQILDLQENELDWLARHLGHDISVHREYYRLHESTIELAKVGKILTTVDEGKTGLWAGKSLDDIDLDKDIDPIAEDRDSELDEDSTAGMEPHSSSGKQKGRQRSGKSRTAHETPVPKKNAMTEQSQQATQATGKENVGPVGARKKRKPHSIWTKEEKEEVLKHLGDFIKNKILPGKTECVKCIEQSNGVLANRQWSVVKDCVRNIISRAKTLQGQNC
ncbi:uncharacterized protein LOC114952155 isoform X4 [Acropora millepora]|uniref:uncharacterized protein LOC114952155 isoform X4 n=1 Tax=Acropora millepora TaxID=45264 RepID=UPI001CF17AF0|nr:uncharacterized protein LOC114952155 isoform X4 [Acropora millepora]